MPKRDLGTLTGREHDLLVKLYAPTYEAFGDLIKKRRQPKSLREALREVAQRHHASVER